MLIYNTTYHADDDVHDNFMIWLKESYIPSVEEYGVLRSPRLCRLLSHQDEGTAYSLQWEVDDSASLHRWRMKQGLPFNEELAKIFGEKVIGIPTLMEVLK